MGQLFLQMDLPLPPCLAVCFGPWQPTEGREVCLCGHIMVGHWLCDLGEFSPPTQDLCIPLRVLVRLFDYLDHQIVHGGSCYQFQLATLTYHLSQSIDFGNAKSVGDKLGVLLSGTNGTLMAALTATFGIYVISSFLYGDPYHIFTSLVSFCY
jgi:hypothetical protein